jgi:acyl carrier protein
MFELICDVLRENARLGGFPAHIGDVLLTPQMNLSDLGLDSLSRLTVLSELCGRLGIPQFETTIRSD